jgi:hypothetical protein
MDSMLWPDRNDAYPSSLSSSCSAEIRFRGLEYFLRVNFSFLSQQHHITLTYASSLITMPQYKSVSDFIVRRAAAGNRASERQIREQLEISRQKVESNESLAPVHRETLEYIIEYSVWAFFCKFSPLWRDQKLISSRASRCVHRVSRY